ncbi:MAG: hypothetical protein GY950_10560, partial [bacterium]|nr:hypothetical protein [bacterium]
SALAHLRQLYLLSTEEEGREEVLDCHPLVREHFGEKLRKNNPRSWQEAHARLYNYYKNLPEKEPNTLKKMEPLFTAVTHGCLAGKHQDALMEVFWSRIRRGKDAYSWKKLGAFGFDLAALSGFFDNPWSQLAPGLTEDAQGFVLNETAFDLRALGRLREAAQPMEAGLEAAINQKNWKQAAIRASNLSELYLTLGEVKRSVEAARKSVELADKSEDAFQQYSKRTTLADALHQAGEVTEAGKWFREAEAMQKKDQPQYPYLYSQRCYRFCDLLLGQGQYEEVQKRAENGLKVAKESNLSLLTHALDTLTLGRARWLQTLDRGKRDFQPALDHLHRAVDGLRESGNQDDLPRGLLAHAAVYRTAKEFETARHDLEEAREIAERGAMKLHMADYHLESARLYHHMGKKQEALPHIETADKLIRETGYRRRDEEIEEIINY